jgi:hypothetical protein
MRWPRPSSATEQALVLAAGVVVEATAPRGTFPVREAVKVEVNDSLPVTVTVFNRGASTVQLRNASVAGMGLRPGTKRAM